MEESNNCLEQFEYFKNDVENRSRELMDLLENSRNTFWENVHACRDYVLEQVQK